MDGAKPAARTSAGPGALHLVTFPGRARGVVSAFLLVSVTTCGGDSSPGPTGPDPTPGGSLAVAAITTGTDLDPDGYSLSVTGIGFTTDVSSNGAVSFALDAGSATVTLGGVADNCTPSPGLTQSVVVPSGGTVSVTFAVVCADNVGSLSITTTTTGNEQDDGYLFVLGGGASTLIGNSETIRLDALDVGSLSVELIGIADNCTVAGDNPRNVNVMFDTNGTTTFAVTCVRPLQLSFSRRFEANDFDVFVTRLTNNPALDYDGVWSPDGTQIAFVSDRDGGDNDIYVMDANGGSVTRITTSSVNEYDPRWRLGG